MADLSHRKASTKLQIKGADGKILSNAKVHVNQVNHEFLFGCGAFGALPYTNGPSVHNGNGTLNEAKPMTDEEKEAFRVRLEDRMQKWLGLFNYGTLPFYWGGFEPEEGNPNTEKLMAL